MENKGLTKSFITGGGEMGELTRQKDWSTTVVGSPENWPQSLKTIVNFLLNSKFPMFLWWGPDLICFYNDAYRPSLGKEGKHPSILGMRAEEAWPEIWTIIKPLIDQVLTTGEATWSENQLIPIYRNNKIEDVYWTFSYSPVNDELNKPGGVFVTCYETTQQIQNLSALEEREDTLNFTIDAAELGTWDLDPVTKRFVSNARLKSWFGLPHTAEIELPLAIDIIIEKDRQRVIDAIQTAMQYSSGGKYNIEYTILNPLTNQERIVVAKGKAEFDENNIAYRFSGTLQDITQQVLAVKNLKESEQKFRVLADSMPQFVWTSDPQGNLNYYNQSVLEYSGLKAEEVKDNNWFQIVHPDDREENIRKWVESISTGHEYLFEHRFRRSDGIYRWHLSRATPQRDAQGNIQMWVGTSTDIEAQKAVSNRLEKEVENQIIELERKNKELERINTELESFAYVASHDLQEPLRKIQTFSGRLLEKETQNLSDLGKDYLHRVRKSISRMQTLINDLLAYSRTNTIERVFEKIHIIDIINEVKEDFKEIILEKNATIQIEDDCEIKVIPFQFKQVMSNLIGNSLKFSKPGIPPIIQIKSRIVNSIGKNDLSLLPNQKYCQITIADNGIGFEEEYKDRIFEIFQRLHGKSEYKGTGIGLAIVKKIVDNHNGVIMASGIPNEGATFDIFIPVNQN